jgi:ABC-type nitrate/sulfonate/bicarbonate transport system substrate-binding protein
MTTNGSKGTLVFLFIGVLVLAGGIGGYVYLKNPNLLGQGKGNALGDKEKRENKNRPEIVVDVKPLQNTEVLKVPFILWGGDIVTFQANGDLKTQPGSLFDQHGLKLELVPGDNFDDQLKAYFAGESPFLRGTFSMLGTKCDILGKDPRTRPVIFLQLTWSAGDHMVARAGLKTLADLKGAKVALQKDGPHVGMLDDILRTARLSWKDIQVEWTDDVTGDKGPGELFRKDRRIDACFAITPDMTALTGGLDKVGDGKDKSIDGAHVLVSTADMKRSIADVYACRKDFYDTPKGKEIVERLAAGYLKACEVVVEMKKETKKTGSSAAYKELLKLAQKIYGQNAQTKDGCASDDDADGLLTDAVLVGLPGNKAFFTDPGNLSGFEFKQEAVLDLAVNEGYASKKETFLKPDAAFYDRLKTLGRLTGQAAPENRFRNDLKLLDANTIYTFTIHFEPNEKKFSEEKYGEDFKRALMQASLFGNAVMAVRGHADPAKLIAEFLSMAQNRRVLRRSGPGFVLADGSPFDINNTKGIIDLINKHNLTSNDENHDPKGMVEGLQILSQGRADGVRDAVVKYAESRRYRLDKSQIRGVGVGVQEPAVPNPDPNNNEQMAANRRVEFRLIRVASDQRGEAISAADFDY